VPEESENTESTDVVYLQSVTLTNEKQQTSPLTSTRPSTLGSPLSPPSSTTLAPSSASTTSSVASDAPEVRLIFDPLHFLMFLRVLVDFRISKIVDIQEKLETWHGKHEGTEKNAQRTDGMQKFKELVAQEAEHLHNLLERLPTFSNLTLAIRRKTEGPTQQAFS